MSKLYCEYDHSNPKVEIADHKCDFCGKLLCKICGYTTDEGVQLCNECYKIVENCDHDCTSDCRHTGCNCDCGEFHIIIK